MRSLVPAVAKQAKLLEQKLRLQQGEDDEEEGGSDDGDGAAGASDALWGPNKRAYYHADTAEVRRAACVMRGCYGQGVSSRRGARLCRP